MEKKKKILMVCLGNICRSTMAEGIARHIIEVNNLNWEVDSAGTAAYHIGNSPDPRSIKEALRNGIDISYQRARQFTGEDFDRFDHIYAMDESNLKNINSLANSNLQLAKTSLILDEIYPDEHKSVPDPYWDDNGFAAVYTMLYDAIEHIVKGAVSATTDP